MMAVVLADDGAPVTVIAGTLTTVLLRAIEADPADRWRDLQQFQDALGPVVDQARETVGAPLIAQRGCVMVVAIVGGGGLVLWALAQYIA